MWGNSTGWGLSAVLAGLMAILLYFYAAPPTIIEATNDKKLAIAHKPVALPVDPDTVVKYGSQPGNAGDEYRKVIQDYTRDHSQFDKFSTNERMSVPRAKMPAIEYIVKARDFGPKFDLFMSKPSEVVNYDNDQDSLIALREVGNACLTMGLIEKKTKPAEGLKLFEAAFIMGRHLVDERVSWKELEIGLGLVDGAARDLATYYDATDDKAKAEAAHTFDDRLADYKQQLLDAETIIGTISEQWGGKYAGDIFAIARDEKNADPVFRVEALKHIGHYRYNALSKGEQLGARRILPLYTNDPNPAVKAAATAARDLTIEQHNMVGGTVDTR